MVNDVFGVVESVQSASDLFMPIEGEVVECNEELNNSPEKVNQDPYGDGWMIKISSKNISDMDKLLDSQSYQSEVG